MTSNRNRSLFSGRSKSSFASLTTIVSMVAIQATGSLLLADASFAQGAPADGAQQPAISLPDPVQRMLNGAPTGQGQAPVVVPPITFVDINSGRFGKLEIDLEDAQFLDGAADHLHLIARNLDVREGVLKSLDISVSGGHLRDFIVDQFTLKTQGSMRFDAGVLVNQRVLQFIEPTVADVTAEISQESLNKFINAPSTIDRLSAQVGKRAGALASIFGGKAPGLTVSNGQLVLAKGNHVNLKFDAKVGIGEVGVPMPVEIDSVLALQDGWVQVTGSKLLTSGQEISPAISQWLVKKINELSQFGAQSDDIHFRFTELKMKPGKGFFLKGTAEVNRLRFGRQQ